MDRLDHLEEHFAAGRKWLTCEGVQAFLLEKKGALHRRTGPGTAAFVIVDLEEFYKRFLALAEGFAQPFSISDVAALTGRSYLTAYRAVHRDPVLAGGARHFTLAEAFALTVAATLQRHNVSPEATRTVANMIAGVAQQQEPAK